jgi:hypothetical protein
MVPRETGSDQGSRRQSLMPACPAAKPRAVRLVVTTDQTSNGPQVLYPAPSSMGGAPVSRHWVLDSFARDPWAGTSMLAAGEAVAAESGVYCRELDELAALRSEQYHKALAYDRAFQRRYMVEAQIPLRRKPPRVIDATRASGRSCWRRSRRSRPPQPMGCIPSLPRPTRRTPPLACWSLPSAGQGTGR